MILRFTFTDAQTGMLGRLPYTRCGGEYEFAESAAADFTGLAGARQELRGIQSLLCGESPLEWRFFQGKRLGVCEERIHTALVPYALRAGLGRVYRIKVPGLIDLMRVIHCWRCHGVTMAGLDVSEELGQYALNDEVPFEAFKTAVDKEWTAEPADERVIFLNSEGFPTSIYGTPLEEYYGACGSVEAAIGVSAYETMCCYVTSAKQGLSKSVQLLGIAEDSCYILDTSARNGDDIAGVFSNFVFPKWFFLRFLRFENEVTQVTDIIQ
ncbi:hypothetical protein FACS1894208_02190 [Clostridia bacterium]|nr:hypothetical protein FACS1894208_02190 [Clostridia bacterium]